jgi:hypothetical protein
MRERGNRKKDAGGHGMQKMLEMREKIRIDKQDL